MLTDILWDAPHRLHLGPLGPGDPGHWWGHSRWWGKCSLTQSLRCQVFKCRCFWQIIVSHKSKTCSAPNMSTRLFCHNKTSKHQQHTWHPERNQKSHHDSYFFHNTPNNKKIKYLPWTWTPKQNISYIPNFCYVPGWRYLMSFANQSYQQLAALTLVILCIFPLSSCVFNLVSPSF